MRTFAKSPLFYLARRIKGYGTSPDGLLLRVTRMVALEVVARDAGGVHGVGACRPGTSATREVITQDIRGIKGQEGVLHGAGLPVSRTLMTIVIATVVAMTMGAAPALASEPCPNETVRAESNVNPATHEPYDLGLPECRAYEMVSPAEKGGAGVSATSGGLPVAPTGETAGFLSQVAFGDAENYELGGLGEAMNPYIAQRTPTGWSTSSVLAPARLIGDNSDERGLDGDTTPDLGAVADCGLQHTTINLLVGVEAVCARRNTDGTWLSSPTFPSTTGNVYGASESPYVSLHYEGSSANLNSIIFESQGGSSEGAAFLNADTSASGADALYELHGLGTESAELSLIDVNASGEQIGPAMGARIGGISSSTGQPQPCGIIGVENASSDYQAISTSGDIVYFTACPSNTNGGANTLYARRDRAETVAISSPSPSQCATCNQTPESAAFEGASADGAKAFFLTTQQLVPEDTDSTLDLYEWDFDKPAGKNLVQLSAGGLGDVQPGAGAEVQGVVRTSPDGSHVYFVARGVLTAIPTVGGQSPQLGADNLYAIDTETGETKFVAELCSGGTLSGTLEDVDCAESDTSLWGTDQQARRAQTTPNGRYLVFTTYAKLITSGSEADTNEAQQVYRYDFDTGTLVRISIGEPSHPASNNGNVPGANATISPPDNGGPAGYGAMANVNDYARAISSDGAYVVFATPAALQANTNTGAHPSCSPSVADATGCDVYLWHECAHNMCADGMAGAVNKISPDTDTTSEETADGKATISETGSDVFFFSDSRLVDQDEDELRDIYDARIDGGFPAPTPEPSCSGEACQGNPSASPAGLKPEGSATQQPGGNLASAPFKETLEPETKSKSKPLTDAQKLAKALSACRRDKAKKTREACEKTARKKYPPAKHKTTKKH